MVASPAAPAADGPALSVEELARCAQQVRHLRGESVRLMSESERLEAQRVGIEERRRAVEADAAGRGRDDLAANLALSERRSRLNAEATTLNDGVARLREQIAALNGVKRDYEALCAQRPYRRADLEALPQADQAAMRAGLDDVQVPYVE